jgi:hypothetical protein
LKQGDPLSPILFNLAMQKVIQNIQMVPGGIKIGKERLNVLAYADYIVLLGKNEIEIRQLFIEMESAARKLGLQINQEKTKHMIAGRKNTLRQNTGHLKIKNYKFESVESVEVWKSKPKIDSFTIQPNQFGSFTIIPLFENEQSLAHNLLLQQLGVAQCN